jgi:putative protein-disulfide isomerase
VRDHAGAVRVEHRAFALAPTPDAIVRIFGDPERGKREILGHWAQAARQPDGEPIDPSLMAERPFPYPWSIPGLRACEAAERLAGAEAHWDLFDRIQRAHLVECRNIADPEVLVACAREVGLEEGAFRRALEGPEVAEAVEADLAEAAARGIHAVPTMVFEDRWLLQGAVPEAALRRVVEDLLEGRTPSGRR